MTTTQMIRARGLGKSFSAGKSVVQAVQDLDLDVPAGQLLAFLGPNGAGKSTTARMLTTLLPPTTGEATVAGCDIRRDPAGVRARIGYVGQGTSAGHNQRVRDELLTQGAFFGMPRREAARRADELLESLDLGALATRGVMGLSGGQRRRLDIAIGLMNSPRLLFLDEPSTGLDPQSRANLWRHILDLRDRHGTTVFVTTHYLEEADQFAERVLVMDHGRVIADDDAESLKVRLAGDRIALRFVDAAAAAGARAEVAALSGAEPELDEASIGLTVEGGERMLPRLVRALPGVVGASLRLPTLDDVFLALTGRSLRDAGDAPAEPGSDPAAEAAETVGAER